MQLLACDKCGEPGITVGGLGWNSCGCRPQFMRHTHTLKVPYQGLRDALVRAKRVHAELAGAQAAPKTCRSKSRAAKGGKRRRKLRER